MTGHQLKLAYRRRYDFGGIFWFTRNRFAGSYFAFTAWSRA